MTGYIRTDTANSIPFDNDSNGYTSDNTQEAIEETKFNAGVSQYAVIFAYNGVGANKFLELFSSISSDTSPFVIVNAGQITGLSVSVKVATTATYTVYVNGISVDTLTITAETIGFEGDLTHSVSAGDYVSVKITDGSAQDSIFSCNINTAA